MKKLVTVLLSTTILVSCGLFKKVEDPNADPTAENKSNAPAEKPDKDLSGEVKMSKNDGDYVQMGSGLEYLIIHDEPGDVYPDYGDFMEVHLNTVAGDSVIFDTRSAMGNGEPAPLQLQESPFKGDLMVALRKFTAGDSARVRILVDSLLAAGVPKAPWMNEGTGQKITYNLQVISVTPKELKEKQEAEAAAQQIEVDDKLIQEYLAENNIEAERTGTGLYYVIKKEGVGPKAEKGKKVSVNYTGMLLNGEKFDSNVDPQFQHVQPFEFVLGTGSVIQGWDEGIALLSKGGKATLYIPSGLAYGSRSPSPKIPPNSVLVFDVELMDILSTNIEK